MGTRKPKRYDYDVLVIGSGSGGGVAAHIAVRQGKRVAIVEDHAIGGECPNYGCVPTKALLTAAESYRNAKEAKQFGIRTPTVGYNYATIKKWKDLAVYRTGTSEGEEAFSGDGIDIIKGHAHFLSPHEVSVHKKRYTARQFVIATGTKQFVPPIEGLKESGYITYAEAIDLTKLSTLR